MLQSMESQRVGHDWATEQWQWDVISCHNVEWEGCYWHHMGRGSNAAKHLTMQKAALTTKKISTPNVTCAKGEKPWNNHSAKKGWAFNILKVSVVRIANNNDYHLINTCDMPGALYSELWSVSIRVWPWVCLRPMCLLFLMSFLM